MRCIQLQLGNRRLWPLLLLALCAFALPVEHVSAQLKLPLRSNLVDSEEKNEAEKSPAIELSEWRSSVSQRLEELNQEIEAAEKDPERKPSAAQKQRQEVLNSLDITLSQLEDERAEQTQLQETLAAKQQEHEEFSKEGFAGQQFNFLELDRFKDRLAVAKRRQKSLASRVKEALDDVDVATEESDKRASQSRLAREAFDTSNDATRPALGNELAEAVIRAELAKAVAELRKQELANLRADLAGQKAQVELLSEKVDRIGTNPGFSGAVLKEKLEEIDKKRASLKRRLEEHQSKAARGSTTDSEVNQAKLRVFRKQLQRLKAYDEIWERRQKVFLKLANPGEIRTWKSETEDSLDDLEDQQGSIEIEIGDIESQLVQIKKQFEETSEDARERSRLLAKIESMNSILVVQKQGRSDIVAARELHSKLLAELDTGSLATTAKDKLFAVRDTLLAVWNQELMTIGESPLTVSKVVSAILLLLIGILASRTISQLLGTQILRRLDIDPSAAATIQSLFFYTFLLIFTLFSLKVVNVPLTALTYLGGALALGIGFGSQNIINNFFSGLILHAERPVKVGDLIQLDDLYGNVEHIGARSTRVRTGSNLEIIVPNSTFLQNNVINFTLSSDKVRTLVEVGVVYGSPVLKVTQLLRRAVIETGRASKDPPPIILFKEFGNNALIFEIHFWIRMRTVMDRSQVESAVRFQIEQLFKEAGIVIAFPQRDVHLDTVSPLKIEMVPPPTDSSQA